MTASSPAGDAFVYGVDASDTIRSLGDAWLAFARENGAPELTRDTVLGRSLWEFVTGDTSRELYDLIFARVRRERQLVVLPFRCDSPERFRFMQLVVAPGSGAALELRGELIREQARPYLPILDRILPRSVEALPMCSICLKIRIHGSQWVEAEQAVERLSLFESARIPPLDYRVCEECARRARAPEGSHASA